MSFVHNSSSWLMGVKLDVVFCCRNPSDTSFYVLCILTCFSANQSYKECVFDLLYTTCQLKPAWLFSSDLFHQQSISAHKTSLHVFFFNTIVCKLYRLFCSKPKISKVFELLKRACMVPITQLNLSDVLKLPTCICMILCIVNLLHDWLIG